MDTISTLIKVSLPRYLKGLPIPDSLAGFASLTGKDLLALVPFVGTVSFLVYVTVQAFRQPRPAIEHVVDDKGGVVNPNIQKDSAKVVEMVAIEDLGDKVSYCRCWRSKKFPYCDGSHNKHNAETGDNVGPLCLKRK